MQKLLKGVSPVNIELNRAKNQFLDLESTLMLGVRRVNSMLQQATTVIDLQAPLRFREWNNLELYPFLHCGEYKLFGEWISLLLHPLFLCSEILKRSAVTLVYGCLINRQHNAIVLSVLQAMKKRKRQYTASSLMESETYFDTNLDDEALLAAAMEVEEDTELLKQANKIEFSFRGSYNLRDLGGRNFEFLRNEDVKFMDCMRSFVYPYLALLAHHRFNICNSYSISENLSPFLFKEDAAKVSFVLFREALCCHVLLCSMNVSCRKSTWLEIVGVYLNPKPLDYSNLSVSQREVLLRLLAYALELESITFVKYSKLYASLGVDDCHFKELLPIHVFKGFCESEVMLSSSENYNGEHCYFSEMHLFVANWWLISLVELNSTCQNELTFYACQILPLVRAAFGKVFVTASVDPFNGAVSKVYHFPLPAVEFEDVKCFLFEAYCDGMVEMYHRHNNPLDDFVFFSADRRLESTVIQALFCFAFESVVPFLIATKRYLLRSLTDVGPILSCQGQIMIKTPVERKYIRMFKYASCVLKSVGVIFFAVSSGVAGPANSPLETFPQIISEFFSPSSMLHNPALDIGCALNELPAVVLGISRCRYESQMYFTRILVELFKSFFETVSERSAKALSSAFVNESHECHRESDICRVQQSEWAWTKIVFSLLGFSFKCNDRSLKQYHSIVWSFRNYVKYVPFYECISGERALVAIRRDAYSLAKLRRFALRNIFKYYLVIPINYIPLQPLAGRTCRMLTWLFNYLMMSLRESYLVLSDEMYYLSFKDKKTDKYPTAVEYLALKASYPVLLQSLLMDSLVVFGIFLDTFLKLAIEPECIRSQELKSGEVDWLSFSVNLFSFITNFFRSFRLTSFLYRKEINQPFASKFSPKLFKAFHFWCSAFTSLMQIVLLRGCDFLFIIAASYISSNELTEENAFFFEMRNSQPNIADRVLSYRNDFYFYHDKVVKTLQLGEEIGISCHDYFSGHYSTEERFARYYTEQNVYRLTGEALEFVKSYCSFLSFLHASIEGCDFDLRSLGNTLTLVGAHLSMLINHGGEMGVSFGFMSCLEASLQLMRPK